MQKNILVTGGCGFLGQHLIAQLSKEFPGSSIRILDLKQNQACSFGQDVTVVLKKNICDYKSISAEFKDIDIVIHLAGIVSFAKKDKKLLEAVHICGTRNVIKACQEHKVKTLIHVSSVAALGFNDDKHNPIDDEFQFDWKLARSRNKYYMLTKHDADLEIRKARHAAGHKEPHLNTVIVYPGLLLGPGDVVNSAKLINAIRNCRIPFNMPGGTNVIDVRDVASGIVLMIKKDVKNKQYLLSGYNLTFKQINSTIAGILKVKCPKTTLPKRLNFLMYEIFNVIESVSPNVELTSDNVDSAFKFRYFSNEKTRQDLGWKPKIGFDQTIKDTVEWMKKNKI